MQTAVMAQPPPPQPAGFGPLPVRRKPVTNPNIAIRPPQPQTQAYYDPNLGHSRTRTTSSGIFPVSPSTTSTMHSQFPPPTQGGLRRTPTSSTSSTTGTPHRSNSNNLGRSPSTRSGNSPTSYVALMRKQKATVWCDRSQYEDPRILAQQRQAKMRANMEVAGGPHHFPPRNASGSSGTSSGVRIKVRHHGVPKASLYAPQTYTGSGVPMRLSASEVDEGDDEETSSQGKGAGPYHHHRTGSGRSSLGSGRRIAYANPSGRLSSSSTPPSGHHSSPSETMGDLQEEPTPVPTADTPDYFEHTKTGLSYGSGSSGERNFGDVGQMKSLPKPEHEKKDDLVRRGSVDERTMTMSNTRLFIANPDLSD